MKNEKGISLIALLLVIIVIVGCVFLFKVISNNNSKNTTGISNTSNNSSTNNNTNNEKNSSLVGSWQNGSFIYTFNADGTATLSGQGLNTQNFTYKIKGNKFSLTNTETNGTMDVEYSIKDDKLYTNNGNTIYTKIK